MRLTHLVVVWDGRSAPLSWRFIKDSFTSRPSRISAYRHEAKWHGNWMLMEPSENIGRVPVAQNFFIGFDIKQLNSGIDVNFWNGRHRKCLQNWITEMRTSRSFVVLINAIRSSICQLFTSNEANFRLNPKLSCTHEWWIINFLKSQRMDNVHLVTQLF